MSSPTGLSIIQGISASFLEFSVSGFVVCVQHEIDLLLLLANLARTF